MTFDPAAQSLDVDFSVPCTHRVRFTRDVLGADRETLTALIEPSSERPARVQFWIDQQVADARPDLRHKLRALASACPGRIELSGNVQFVPGGEEVKNDIHVLERMLKVFNAADLDRRSYVIVVGGGAVLDAVGFAASIAHRGIRLIRLPTTTLAQADSAIGVKSAVNLFGKKNWVGSFGVPWAVVNDAELLSTLSDRDFVCGFSEAVKVSLLKDPAMFDELAATAARIRRRDLSAALPMIRASAYWHLNHITRGGDPFENREARPLDFGHWSAHKLETLSEFQLRHGEAVAIGVAVDAVYSSLALGFPEADAVRVLACLADLGFELDHAVLAGNQMLFAGLEEFRQHLGGRLTITMLQGVGQPVDVHEVDRGLMTQAIERVGLYARERRNAAVRS